MRKRIWRIGFAAAGCAGVLFACSSDPGLSIGVAPTTNPAAVVIEMRDASGEHVGTCAGTLISSSTVITAGHCVAGMGSWVVTAPNARGQTATGVKGFTTWQAFRSNWSHPYHSDVGVILLDRQVFVSDYPTVANALAPSGTTLARLRRDDPQAASQTTFSEVLAPVFPGEDKGFFLTYWTVSGSAELDVDTGGALVDPTTNTLYGVVSGRGTTSGALYVARVDYLEEWIRSISECSPPPQGTQCHPNQDAGDDGGSSGGGSGSGSGSGGSSGGSSGWNGSSGSGSGSSGGDDGGTCNPPPPPPPPRPPSDGGCGSSGGSSGGTSSGSSGGHSSSGSGGSSGASSGGSSGSSSGGNLIDSGIVLVPDGPGCVDANCGGCGGDPNCNDNVTDYGDCGCNPQNPAPEAGPIF